MDVVEGEVEEERVARCGALLDEAHGGGGVARVERVQAGGLRDDSGVGKKRQRCGLVGALRFGIACGWLAILGGRPVAQEPVAEAH